MSSRWVTSVSLVCSLSFCLLVSWPTAAQTLTAGDPGANVNVVGPTPDEADIRDYGLKQQNEPSCAIRPGDSACIICGFNDYRTVDVPGIEDAWQGVAMSCDAGTTWTSRIAPGYPTPDPLIGTTPLAPIGTEFAADPRMIALPGMAIFNFIGGDRDQNSGVLAIQHWLEVNKEDADFYEPGLNTIIADTGSSGRFIDKPDAVALLDKPQNQGTITLSTLMENPDLGTITRDFPTGKLFVAFAVFTGNPDSGSQSVKVLVKESDDWGKSWSNQTKKLSEDQNLVSGISLTAMGDSVLAVWRRAGDINDFDSIMYAYTNNRGRKWTKGKVLADICSFDQISATTSTAVTFRTNDFPWATNDGKNFYVFYSDRNYDGNGDCSLGRPRIVMKHASSGSGLNNSPLTPLDDPGDGSFQFMPAAFGANGKVQVAWYDTRREEIPVAGSPPVIADYLDGAGFVHRQVDVFTTRVTSDQYGNLQTIPPPVRVSQFRIRAVLEETNDGATIGSTAIEGEASFANAKLYASGSLSFIGDYIAVAGQQFRYDDDGKVISNATPVNSPTVDNTDFFVAWADNRDVRGNIFDPTSLETVVPYAPPVNEPAGSGKASPQRLLPEHEKPRKSMLASTTPVDEDVSRTTRTTEGVEDPFDPVPDVCMPGAAQDRTRNANIYGARIRDRVRLTAPTPTKPLTNLQRAFPIALSNANPTEQSYRLRITRQPVDAISDTGRASFRQLPAVPPFDGAPAPVIEEDITVPPKSALARTVFLVSNIPSATTEVKAFELTCDADDVCTVGAAVASITLGGTGASGPLQDPNYQSPVCDASDTEFECSIKVADAELHNPELINPELINPELINPELINPELINPELINPELINPELINPELINLGFANPELINPELINPELINPELINPELINPELINPELINSSFDDGEGNVTLDEDLTWTDYTYIVRNTGNVTTAYNADIQLSGEAADDVDSQLIAWTLYITPTSRDCDYKPQVERRVLATVNNPDDELAAEELEITKIEEPFNGDISAIAAPGQTLFFTRRVFGTPTELENVSVSGFTTASQAANCSQTDKPPGDPYFCQLIEDERERILLDTQPPVFVLPDPPVVPDDPIEADRPGGACVVVENLVTALDNGDPVAVSCTDTLGQSLCTNADPMNGQSIPVSLPDNPLGALVTCTASDDAVPPNVAVVELYVDVRDTEPPMFTSIPDENIGITIEVGPGGTGPSSFNPDATVDVNFEDGIEIADYLGVDPSPTFYCEAQTDPVQQSSGSLPVGTTEIRCSAEDASGNRLTQSYPVIVVDNIPPVFDQPLPTIEIGDYDMESAVVIYDNPTASDGDTGGSTTTVSCSPASGSEALLDDNDQVFVTCTADDGRGNTAQETLVATVIDDVPPVIIVPDDIVVAPQEPAGASVEYTVQFSDNFDPDPTLLCSPASGSIFPIGETTVDCTATDARGNEASASFLVTVAYGGFGITPKKLNSKAGSSNPLSWGWYGSDGSILDTSNDLQILEFSVCGDTTMFTVAGDPGSSGFRIKTDNSWEYNWQSDDGAGFPLQKGLYCVRVTSAPFLQPLESPPINVR